MAALAPISNTTSSVSSSAAASAAQQAQAKEKTQAAAKKRSLSIHERLPDRPNCKEIQSIAEKWMKQAEEYAKDTPPKAGEWQTAFESLEMIARGISKCMALPTQFLAKYDSIHRCEDSTGIIQGLMLTKLRDIIVRLVNGEVENRGKYLNIVYITTNPFNIRSPLTERQQTRIKGTGTIMLLHAAKQAIKAKAIGLYAEGTLHSISFYKKFGFVQLPGADGDIETYLHNPGGTFTGPWIISIEKMKELAKQGVKPYALLKFESTEKAAQK